MSNASGTMEVDICDATFEFKYVIQHDAGCMYHGDGTGTPPHTEVEIELNQAWNISLTELELRKYPKGEKIEARPNFCEVVGWELDYVYYEGKNLYDYLSEAALEEEGY